MKTLIVSLVAALSGGMASAAQADGQQVYQHVVLGDTRVNIAAPQPTNTIAYGSYARYRLHHGASPEVALADARAIGEVAPAAVPAVAAEPLTGYAAYRRVVLGQRVAQIAESQTDTTVARAR